MTHPPRINVTNAHDLCDFVINFAANGKKQERNTSITARSQVANARQTTLDVAAISRQHGYVSITCYGPMLHCVQYRWTLDMRRIVELN